MLCGLRPWDVWSLWQTSVKPNWIYRLKQLLWKTQHTYSPRYLTDKTLNYFKLPAVFILSMKKRHSQRGSITIFLNFYSGLQCRLRWYSAPNSADWPMQQQCTNRNTRTVNGFAHRAHFTFWGGYQTLSVSSFTFSPLYQLSACALMDDHCYQNQNIIEKGAFFSRLCGSKILGNSVVWSRFQQLGKEW